MKKFLDRSENVVEEIQQALAVLSPGIVRLPGHKVMYGADAVQIRDRQVAIISGGGSGHEPAHAGYIAAGMLSAAVAGEVFTSPDTYSVVASQRQRPENAGPFSSTKNIPVISSTSVWK